MSNRNLTISDPVRQKLTTLGAQGQQWLAGLEDLVSELAQEWQLTIGKSLEGGSEAYVAEVTTSDGSPAILKVAVPYIDGNTILASEVTALTLAGGRGYVRLLRSDLNRRALLLERLGLRLQDLGYSTTTQIDIICATLKESWIPVPPGTPLQTGDEIARWLAQFITNLWEQLNRPCSQQAFETALSYTQARASAYDPQTSVLVHGDAHSLNTLQSLSPHSPSTFKLIDPDGIVAETAYDVGMMMRDWLDEISPDPVKLGRQRCEYLSHLTGADKEAIWHWGFIQSVSTGLLLTQMGLVQEGSQMLSTAEAWSKT